MIQYFLKKFLYDRFNYSIRLFLLCFLLSLIYCAPSRWARRIDWDECTFDTLPTQEDYPDAGAVVLLDEADLHMGNSGEMKFSQLERHMIVKILNERGYANANILIPYGRGTRITGIKGRTIRPKGDIVF